MRIIKKYHERKREFLDTARKLFFTQGYEQTSVDSILKEVGLSKGSFYYYFKSKEDLLDELTKELIVHILDEIQKIVNRDDLDAVTKLNEAFSAIGSIKLKNMSLIKTLQKAFYDDKNVYFRYKVFQNSTDMLAPEFVKIICQGITEGCFHTPYPEENARMFFELSFILSEKIPKLMIEMDRFPENAERIERELENFQFAIERILGADVGSVRIFDHNLLTKFFNQPDIPQVR